MTDEEQREPKLFLLATTATDYGDIEVSAAEVKAEIDKLRAENSGVSS